MTVREGQLAEGPFFFFLKSGEQHIEETSMCLGSEDVVFPEHHGWDNARRQACCTRMCLSLRGGHVGDYSERLLSAIMVPQWYQKHHIQ